MDITVDGVIDNQTDVNHTRMWGSHSFFPSLHGHLLTIFHQLHGCFLFLHIFEIEIAFLFLRWHFWEQNFYFWQQHQYKEAKWSQRASDTRKAEACEGCRDTPRSKVTANTLAPIIFFLLQQLQWSYTYTFILTAIYPGRRYVLCNRSASAPAFSSSRLRLSQFCNAASMSAYAH